jgi:UDP-N-acetylmuramoyl-L-alanyl-D-glutamate--2,6-diaminopimelate ligase
MIGYLNLQAQAAHWLETGEVRSRARRSSRRPGFPPPMNPTLEQLFEGLTLQGSHGSLHRTVSGIVIDSRRAVPGSIFFALPGRRTDGNSYIDEAIDRGCIAVVSSAPIQLHRPKITYIQVASPREALATISRRFYRHPDQSLNLIGVTGTNGKTTTTYLCHYFLNTPGNLCGLLGTISYDLGARTVPSFRTTPEAVDICGMLAQMRDAGCRSAAMEVSSHGIDQHRVNGLGFKVAVFTNLTRDHLDYHGDMETYYSVKARLFNGGNGNPPAVAAINLDDEWGRRLVSELPASVRVCGFGTSPECEVRAEDIQLSQSGASFTCVWPGGSIRVSSPLVGLYNVSNVLAATAACIAVGANPNEFLLRLPEFKGVPGRMERVDAGQPFEVMVDYAHTDDALRNALTMLRAITPGRLFVVFGCGGNRDRTKRPLMTRAVQDLADFSWATSDNPRREPIEQIFADMRAGVHRPERIAFIEDRRRAISLALDTAQAGDCLLIAGKGHETFQEIADSSVPFDDRLATRELIQIKRLAQPRS